MAGDYFACCFTVDYITRTTGTECMVYAPALFDIPTIMFFLSAFTQSQEATANIGFYTRLT